MTIDTSIIISHEMNSSFRLMLLILSMIFTFLRSYNHLAPLKSKEVLFFLYIPSFISGETLSKDFQISILQAAIIITVVSCQKLQEEQTCLNTIILSLW